MHPAILGVGWFVRRVPDPAATVAFYRDTVGLPILRERDGGAMFWVGETTVLWIALGGKQPPVYTDRSQAPWAPIFRVHDLDGWVARLGAAGVSPINDFETIDSRLVYVLDPSGNVLGLQQRYANSTRPEDDAANARWAAGDTRVDGIPALPAGMQHIGWVARRVGDPPVARAYFEETIGLDLINDRAEKGSMLALGAGVRLDLQPGGRVDPPIRDRTEASDGIILRVTDLQAVVDDLSSRGIEWLNPPFGDGGRLAYFLDLEGGLIGLQERPAASNRPEDIEARRRALSPSL